MMTRMQVTAFLALSLTFWVAMLLFRGVPVTLDMLVPFGSVVGAVSATLLVFDKWIWHWPIFRGWLVRRPHIRGTWRTELRSSWVNPQTNEGIPPIVAFMVVRQTYSTLSLRLMTGESRSETISAAIEICTDGTFEINCAYRNKPKAEYRHRSEVHYGAMLLIADTAAPTRLEGDYWTDRKTTGGMTLTDRCDELFSTFEQASNAHPLADPQ
jgi:SMODS-associating 2TM, beta-strand rich effector domain